MGAQQLPHGRFEFGVADQDDRVAEGLAREGEAEAERAGGRFDHRGAGSQFAAAAGAAQHGDGGPGLHAAGAEAFELRPEAGVGVREFGTDPGDRGAADERQQVGVGGGARGAVQQGCGGHRVPP